MTERRLTLTAAGLAVLGLAIAGYLTYVHYAGLTPVCAGSGGDANACRTPTTPDSPTCPSRCSA